MFETFKVTQAQNSIIMELVLYERFSKKVGILMRNIAGKPENIQYGVTALSTKMASCKYSAAAAMFARIAAHYERHPIDGLTSHEWQAACFHGMALAGANDDDDGESAAMELLEMHRNILSQG